MTALALLAGSGVARADAGRLEIRAKGPLVLGDFDQVAIALAVEEGPEMNGRPLQVSASAGSVESLRRLEAGRYEAIFKPPKTRFPQVAVIAFWFETGPDAEVSFARIPLSAKSKLPCKAKPGAEVRVMMGSEQFGPVKADSTGVAAVPIVVPPGLRDVGVISSGKERRVPVKVPAYNRLVLTVTPHIVKPDAEAFAIVHAYYDAEIPPPSSAIRVTVPRGDLKPLSAEANHYRIRYLPGQNAAEREVTLSGSVDFDENAKAQVSLTLGGPKPDKIFVTSTDQEPDPKGGTRNLFRVLVIDRFGLGVPGEKLAASASTEVVPVIRDRGAGRYDVAVSHPAVPPIEGKVEVQVRVDSENGTISARAESPLFVANRPAAAAAVSSTPAAPRGRTAAFIGARIGGTYEGSISPLGGIDLGVTPTDALAIFLRGYVRVTTQSFRVGAFNNPSISSRLIRVPVLAAVSYDLVRGEDLRLFMGVAGGVVFIAHTITSDLQPTEQFRRLTPCAEAFVGAGYGGLFLEAGGIYLDGSSSDLTLPKLSVALSLGYRLGVL